MNDSNIRYIIFCLTAITITLIGFICYYNLSVAVSAFEHGYEQCPIVGQQGTVYKKAK